MHDLIDQAIKQALSGNWAEAIAINLSILEDNPGDIGTLNRLARAYVENGDKDKAIATYKAVLKVDKYDPIATKNLKLLPHAKAVDTELVVENFIETPGITRSIALIKIGSCDNLALLSAKQKVELVDKGRLISITINGKKPIGCLPDDISFKIKKLLAKGYEYRACIRSISSNAITIFIRETKRPNRPGNTATFSSILTYSKLKK